MELPEAVPPSKRQLALDRLLLELKTATEQLVDATGDSKAFLQAVNRINGDFTAKVMQSRPRFVLSQAAGGGAAAREAGAAENHGDDEQPAVEADYGADGESLGVPSTTSSMTGSISSGGRKRPAASMHGTRMTISDVKRIMEEEHSTELPGFVPYCGLVRIIKQFQDAWKEPAMCCLDQSKEELEKAAMQQVNRTFGRWPDLERIVKLSVVNHITACADTAEQRVKEQLEMEAVGYPMTLNDHYFRNSKEKMLAGVKEAMSSSSAAADDGGSGTAPDSAKAAQERAALAALAALGMSGLSASDLYGKLGASSSDDKVYETIATTMAYFKVASKRFVDYVPLCIRLHLLHAFRNKLFEHVREQLEKFKTGGEQPQTAADLIVDDKHTAATRQKLEDKRAQFEGIRRALATY